MGDSPDFVVLGCPKCGTTSLYHYLAACEDVHLSPKENHFFLRHDPLFPNIAVQSTQEYSAFWSTAGAGVKGDVAVRYLYSEHAREEILGSLPDAKFILMVRNPIDRAVSHYLMRFRTGGYRSTKGGLPTEAETREFFRDLESDVVQFGRYGHYMSQWIAHSSPSRFLVVSLEELSKNPLSAMDRICSFVGIERSEEIDFNVRYNVNTIDQFASWRTAIRRNKLARRVRRSITLRKAVSAVVPRRVLDSLQWRKANAAEHTSRSFALPFPIYEKLRSFYQGDIEQLTSLVGYDFTPLLEAGDYSCGQL